MSVISRPITVVKAPFGYFGASRLFKTKSFFVGSCNLAQRCSAVALASKADMYDRHDSHGTQAHICYVCSVLQPQLISLKELKESRPGDTTLTVRFSSIRACLPACSIACTRPLDHFSPPPGLQMLRALPVSQLLANDATCLPCLPC